MQSTTALSRPDPTTVHPLDTPSTPVHVATPQRQNTLPPTYEFITRSPPGPSRASSTPIRNSSSSDVQAERNKEKQALRDAWAKQDAERDAAARIRGLAQPFGYPYHQSQNLLHRDSNSNSNSSGSSHLPAASPGRSTASLTRDPRDILPPGMDVTEALSRCEDPTLGWSMQFWVTIADPVTQHVFFACPASGHCSWEPPIGAFIVPRSADGEWWELADASRNNRSYYYNTLTGKTQWTRPGGEAFVIPLGLIQRTALPKRPEPKSRTSNPTSPTLLSPNTAASHRRPRQPPAPPSPAKNDNVHQSHTKLRSASTDSATSPNAGQHSPPLLTPTLVFPEAMPTGGQVDLSAEGLDRRIADDSTILLTAKGRKTLSIVEEVSDNDSTWDLSGGVDQAGVVGTAGWWDRRKNKGVLGSPRKGKARALTQSSIDTLDESGISHRTRTMSANAVIPPHDGPRPMPAGSAAISKEEPLEPIYVDSPVKTKRMSTGLHPLLPNAISSQIQSFQTDDFASKYFATKRTGLLRQKKLPIERIMEWQKQPITSPILVLPKTTLQKDAITTFKVIQHVMGERDRMVEGAKPILGSSSVQNLPQLGVGDNSRGRLAKIAEGENAIAGSKGKSSNGSDGSHGPAGGATPGAKDEKTLVLEEIRWMIQLGVTNGDMRDEIYCQLIKQLTKNPEHDALVLGFQLFCVLVHSFGPTKNFETFVRAFLQENGKAGTDGITVMASLNVYADCLNKLDILSAKGGRGRSLTIGEIEHASDAAFYPSVYGESLDRIMSLQSRSYPSLKVPVILPFLADGILALGGLTSEGIFRVPGDADAVSELKSRIDRGHYQLKGIDDPHVVASLFKLWLRELEEPVIPTDMYNAALTASKSTSESLGFVSRLPVYNRRVLLFVISFFQLFVRSEVVNTTKMTPQNLALVLAPNILRTTSEHLVTVFTNSSFESKFILQLLDNLHPEDVDPEYTPSHGQVGSRGVPARQEQRVEAWQK